MNILPLLLGFALDMVWGDPHWAPHPVRLIGFCIAKGEALLRALFPKTPTGEKWAGLFLTLLITALAALLPFYLLRWAQGISPWLSFVLETVLCYQILAMGALRYESMQVYKALAKGDLPTARHALSMIVGRDTAQLEEEQIARAAVETVAENTCDGVIAPLFYLALGGVPLGLWYKAVNTLDSMVGYQNLRYRHFGTASARLDDLANILPARLGGIFLVVAAFVLGYDGKKAFSIFLRDRKNHPSPNSAHTEAACAGALGIQLGGTSTYQGVVKEKQTIGDRLRATEKEDIPRANRLLYVSGILSLLAFLPLTYLFGLF